MATGFIVVTHALTQWNVENRIQGHTDIPLNDAGWDMAQKLAKALMREKIDGIYTSDLRRAYETAAPFAEFRSIPVTRDIRLREGRSIHQERSTQYPTLPFNIEVEDEKIVTRRMTSALSCIGKKNPEKNLLIISHGGAVELFISHVLKTEESPLIYKDVRMALNRLTYDSGRWFCTRLNEDHHL